MSGTTRVRIGQVWIDRLTLDQALAQIAELVARGEGGTVVTPNVDHVVNVERDPALAGAYRRANLSLVDSQILVWAARLLGTPLPEKLSGSDLMKPLLEMAGRRGLRVYLLGGAAGVAEKSARLFAQQFGVTIAGFDDPTISTAGGPGELEVIERIRQVRPDLVMVALGSPKQDVFSDRNRSRLAPAVLLGVGASLDFIAGAVARAPAWMSRSGLEWLFRLCQEPRRLAWRYLVNDPRFVGILLRTLREPRSARLSASPDSGR